MSYLYIHAWPVIGIAELEMSLGVTRLTHDNW